MELKDILIQGVKEIGFSLTEDQVRRFFEYKEILISWNNKYNLTAIKEDIDIIVKHYVDSISVAPFIESNTSKVIDIGSGAGFPGIPLKIILQDIQLVLLDSVQKKTNFLKYVTDKLELTNVVVERNRAEQLGSSVEYREKFDHCVTRAVGNLPTILDYCLPFVQLGGTFIAMKGKRAEEELKMAEGIIKQLGGELEEVKQFELPFSNGAERIIIVVRKVQKSVVRKKNR